MRVGINAEPLFARVPTGAGVYGLSLCQALATVGHASEVELFHAAHELVPADVAALPITRHVLPLDRDELYASWKGSRRPTPQSVCGPLDVVHAPSPTLPPSGGAALVATIHDLAPLRFADRYPRPARLGLKREVSFATREADRVICPSESTAAELTDLLGVGEDRIRVVPHGVSMPVPDAVEAAAFVAKRAIPEPYVLWVGTQEERKNVGTVIEAFGRIAARDESVSLVLHGNQGWLGDEVAQRIRELGLEPRTVASEGSLTRAELAFLFSRATVFVFPSLYEGFGLPVLEAMACGAPVVTSDRSALPESAGDAGVLVDPASVEAVADAVLALLDDPDRRTELRRRGRARAAGFSWDVAARRTWAIYEELVEG
ncbi:MAG: glycosyltransferase family 4 protein [Acidimicrobiia bacterium]